MKYISPWQIFCFTHEEEQLNLLEEVLNGPRPQFFRMEIQSGSIFYGLVTKEKNFTVNLIKMTFPQDERGVILSAPTSCQQEEEENL